MYCSNLHSFLCGSFNNAAQFREMQEKGEAAFPFARHVNTPLQRKDTRPAAGL